jgi:hypothetical protein
MSKNMSANQFIKEFKKRVALKNDELQLVLNPEQSDSGTQIDLVSHLETLWALPYLLRGAPTVKSQIDVIMKKMKNNKVSTFEEYVKNVETALEEISEIDISAESQNMTLAPQLDLADFPAIVESLKNTLKVL